MASQILLKAVNSIRSYKYLAEYKKKQQLTSFQFQALIGLILGDAHVSRDSPTSNSKIFFEQSIIHKSYLFYIYNIFQNLVATPPRLKNRKPHKITGKIYNS
jgi:hypothetical protein